MKKTISLILAAGIIFSLITFNTVCGNSGEPSPCEPPLCSDWAEEGISKAARLNITDYSIDYNYLEDITREQFCELIYNYIDVSMYLMMSDRAFMPEETLNRVELSRTFVSLSVPKFKVEYTAGIRDILKLLGINKAFERDAEFSKMFAGGNMYIDSVLHKTYINVDEEGTEAAAVTAMAMAGSALPPEPVSVKLNKPFTFVIRDNVNGEILFMGEYAFAK